MRANGADTVYMSFGAMVKDFIREDLIELYRTMFDLLSMKMYFGAYHFKQKWLVGEQTATGKENSNPLITDSLLKTIRSVLTDSKVHIKMEVVSTCSSRVKFIATCSYSRLNDLTTSRENDLKLPQL
ncbi:hypothetical protein Tco_0816053 [Tanacetum coccineum]